MANRAANEGFRMLDDFVCEAIHDSAAPRADARHQGKNEDMRILDAEEGDIVPAARHPGYDGLKEPIESAEV